MNAKDMALTALATGGLMSARELGRIGVPSYVLTRLMEAGLIERVGQRGFYGLTVRDDDSGPTRAAVVGESLGERTIRGVHPAIVLRTAAIAHGLTTDFRVDELWMAYPRGKGVRATSPEVAGLKLRLITMDPSMLTPESGIEQVRFGNRTVKMSSIERTIIDMLRFSRIKQRNGNPVVPQADADLALKTGFEKRVSLDELLRIAEMTPRAGWLVDYLGGVGRVYGF